MKEKNMCESSDYYKLTPKQERYLKAKSTADVILGFVGSVVLSPVFLAIACAIKIEDGITAPVIFKQKRVGCGDECFQMYKFRSMKLDTPHDCPTHLLENPEQYITKVGKFLRKTSLDELPQLWNIAAGKLAVIGPRPALWNQDDLIALRRKYGVHQLKPGLTGLAQICGRDTLEIEDKAKMDAKYLRHLGLPLDIWCFLGTFVAVIKGDNVVEGGTGAMKKKENESA